MYLYLLKCIDEINQTDIRLSNRRFFLRNSSFHIIYERAKTGTNYLRGTLTFLRVQKKIPSFNGTGSLIAVFMSQLLPPVRLQKNSDNDFPQYSSKAR
jgi:hypothetical protein